MDINQRKEQFSAAHVRAIAATAGFTLAKPEVDDDSVDFTMGKRGGGGTIRSPKLEFQLKCASKTSDGLEIRADVISYRLKLKNYNELRESDYLVPRILVLVLVDDDVTNWLTESESALTLNSSAYWVSLRGKPAATVSGSKITVHLPRSQPFCVDQVSRLMGRIGDGRQP